MPGDGTRIGSKERFWRRVLRQWRRSGQSVRAFCSEHDLAEPSFYAWRRTIAERDQLARQARCPEAKLGADGRPPATAQPAFVPLRVTPPPVQAIPTAGAPALSLTAAALEVVLGSRCVLRVAPGFDAATLRQLLAVLEETPRC